MSTTKQYISYIQEQFSLLGEVRPRSMMGEYLLYHQGIYFAMVCDNRLFIKVTPAGLALLPEAPQEPPYPGAKPMLVLEDVENKELLALVAQKTVEALPPPAPRKPRKKKGEKPRAE